MSSIDLKRFVDINLKQHTAKSISGTRDTVALFSPEGELGEVKTFTKLSDVTYGDNTDTYFYLKWFFDNGGVKAKVYEGYAQASAITTTVLKNLPNDEILVAYANEAATYDNMKAIATSMNADSAFSGISQKLILTKAPSGSSVAMPTDDTANLIVKYSTSVGAEMTIAAYLTKINVYKANSVFDYAFTKENVRLSPEGEPILDEVDDALFNVIITHNVNVDIMLANAVRNCGGNCKDGADVTNTFVKIVLQQTLTERLVDLLSQKIKNNSGIGKIYTTIAQELENYLNCGYLTTDKVWTDDDLIVTRNGEEYVIIEKGTALTNGYIIKVLPMQSLSLTEKAERKAPPIYLIIADQYGIRKITISGDII